MANKQRTEDGDGSGAPRPADDGGSYTARPSKEVPEEGGRTRDEEDEKVERRGSGPRP
jgi:hypothetical protein